MNETQEYRKNLLDRLLAAAHEFRDRCLQVKDDKAPLTTGSWDLHQIIVHVRDVDRHVYGLRARRILTEKKMPVFQNFDGDAWMEQHYDPKEDTGAMIAEYTARIDELVKMLSPLPDSTWSKPGRHVQIGEKTLQWWVERSLAHLEEHLDTVKKG
jgi:hypothetical protein